MPGVRTNVSVCHRQRSLGLVIVLAISAFSRPVEVFGDDAAPADRRIFQTARFEATLVPRSEARSRAERKSAVPGFAVGSDEQVFGAPHPDQPLYEIEIGESGGDLVLTMTPLSREDVKVESVSGTCVAEGTVLGLPRLVPSNAIAGVELIRIAAKARRCELEIRVGADVSTFDMEVRERVLGGPPK